MSTPKLHTPKGLAALIGAAIYAASKPELKIEDQTFNWQQILSDFQEYNSVKFAEWLGLNYQEKVIDGELYYRMHNNQSELLTVKELFQKWLKEPHPELLEKREYTSQVPFKDLDEDIQDEKSTEDPG